jgi:hypothetical protein
MAFHEGNAIFASLLFIDRPTQKYISNGTFLLIAHPKDLKDRGIF